MKAERTTPRTSFRGTLLLTMATLGQLAKQQRRHPRRSCDRVRARSQTAGKAPCLHLSQVGTSIVKKLNERALSLPGKLPAPSISRDFCLEIRERESAPAELNPGFTAIYGHFLSESAAKNIGR